MARKLLFSILTIGIFSAYKDYFASPRRTKSRSQHKVAKSSSPPKRVSRFKAQSKPKLEKTKIVDHSRPGLTGIEPLSNGVGDFEIKHYLQDELYFSDSEVIDYLKLRNKKMLSIEHFWEKELKYLGKEEGYGNSVVDEEKIGKVLERLFELEKKYDEKIKYVLGEDSFEQLKSWKLSKISNDRFAPEISIPVR